MKKEVVFILFLVLFSCGVAALQEGRCVNYVVTDISPSSINVDEDFTVAIQIDNCGDVLPEFVNFSIRDVSPFITVKEPLEKEVGKLVYANSDRLILYHMHTSKDIIPGTYDIDVKLVYGDGKLSAIKEGNFTIDVIGERADLSVASIKTKPVLPREGETVELTLRVENSGAGAAKSVNVYAAHSFQGVKQAFIGSLDADEDGPAIFTFIADEDGEFNFPVTVNYRDDYGTHETKTDVSVVVLKNNSNILQIIIFLVVAAGAAGLIYYFVKTSKSKDKIIHQLLRGNGEKNKISARKK